MIPLAGPALPIPLEVDAPGAKELRGVQRGRKSVRSSESAKTPAKKRRRDSRARSRRPHCRRRPKQSPSRLLLLLLWLRRAKQSSPSSPHRARRRRRRRRAKEASSSSRGCWLRLTRLSGRSAERESRFRSSARACASSAKESSASSSAWCGGCRRRRAAAEQRRPRRRSRSGRFRRGAKEPSTASTRCSTGGRLAEQARRLCLCARLRRRRTRGRAKGESAVRIQNEPMRASVSYRAKELSARRRGGVRRRARTAKQRHRARGARRA